MVRKLATLARSASDILYQEIINKRVNPQQIESIPYGELEKFAAKLSIDQKLELLKALKDTNIAKEAILSATSHPENDRHVQSLCQFLLQNPGLVVDLKLMDSSEFYINKFSELFKQPQNNTTQQIRAGVVLLLLLQNNKYDTNKFNLTKIVDSLIFACSENGSLAHNFYELLQKNNIVLNEENYETLKVSIINFISSDKDELSQERFLSGDINQLSFLSSTQLADLITAINAQVKKQNTAATKGFITIFPYLLELAPLETTDVEVEELRENFISCLPAKLEESKNYDELSQSITKVFAGGLAHFKQADKVLDWIVNNIDPNVDEFRLSSIIETASNISPFINDTYKVKITEKLSYILRNENTPSIIYTQSATAIEVITRSLSETRHQISKDFLDILDKNVQVTASTDAPDFKTEALLTMCMKIIPKDSELRPELMELITNKLESTNFNVHTPYFDIAILLMDELSADTKTAICQKCMQENIHISEVASYMDNDMQEQMKSKQFLALDALEPRISALAAKSLINNFELLNASEQDKLVEKLVTATQRGSMGSIQEDLTKLLDSKSISKQNKEKVVDSIELYLKNSDNLQKITNILDYFEHCDLKNIPRTKFYSLIKAITKYLERNIDLTETEVALTESAFKSMLNLMKIFLPESKERKEVISAIHKQLTAPNEEVSSMARAHWPQIVDKLTGNELKLIYSETMFDITADESRRLLKAHFTTNTPANTPSK